MPRKMNFLITACAFSLSISLIKANDDRTNADSEDYRSQNDSLIRQRGCQSHSECPNDFMCFSNVCTMAHRLGTSCTSDAQCKQQAASASMVGCKSGYCFSQNASPDFGQTTGQNFSESSSNLHCSNGGSLVITPGTNQLTRCRNSLPNQPNDFAEQRCPDRSICDDKSHVCCNYPKSFAENSNPLQFPQFPFQGQFGTGGNVGGNPGFQQHPKPNQYPGQQVGQRPFFNPNFGTKPDFQPNTQALINQQFPGPNQTPDQQQPSQTLGQTPAFENLESAVSVGQGSK